MLIESLIALTVVTVALTLYSPSAASFTHRVKEGREQTFLARQELEQSRRELKKIENRLEFPESLYVETGVRLMDKEGPTPVQKGINLTDGEWTKEIFLLEIRPQKEIPKSNVTQE